MKNSQFDVIEFPYNKDRYVQLALEQIQKQAFIDAIDYLDKALRITLDAELLEIFCELVIQEREVQSAIDLFTDFKETLMDPQHPLFDYIHYYFECLFIKEDLSLLEQELLALKDHLSTDQLAQLHTRLSSAKTAAHLKDREYTERVKCQLSNYQSCSLTEQALMIQHLANIRDWQLKEPIILQLLNDPYLEAALRYPLLQEVKTYSNVPVIQFKWFGATKEIARSQLFAIEENDLWKSAPMWVEAYFANENIYFANQLQELFYQELLCLYPYVNETIPHYEYWLARTVEKANGCLEFASDVQRGCYRFINEQVDGGHDD